MIKIQKENSSILYLHNEQQVFFRDKIVVKTSDMQTSDFSLELSENEISSHLGEFAAYSEKLEICEDHIISTIKLKVSTNDEFIIQIPINYKRTENIPYYMIPGFLYGTNNIMTSDGNQPRFEYQGEVGNPVSSVFFVRSDRSSNSSVIRIGDGFCSSVGIEHVVNDIEIEQKDKWSPAFLFTGLMLDSTKDNFDITGLQIGYENYPFRYSWLKEDEVPRPNEKLFGFIKNQKNKEITLKAIYYIKPETNLTSYGKVLRSFYSEYHDYPKKVGNRRDSIKSIADSLITTGYNKKDKIFKLTDDKVGKHLGDIAWTGGMQAAYPLLKAGYFAKNEKYKTVALEFINNLCNSAFNNESGLLNEEYRDGKWNVTGWWGTRKDCFNFGDKPLHSAYLNGQAVYYILKSYLLIDEKNSDWLEISQLVLNQVLKTQKENGAFGIFFDPNNGDAVDYDGFQGCWFVPAFTLAYKITNNLNYLIAAEKAIDHYYGWHLKGELYNTPMDTHRAVDQEGNLAFITACKELHEITKKQKYIDYGLVGLDWEFSWKFAYNKVYSNDPLRKINWSSSGGSITSTHNPSIHQMGNLVAGDIYYFYLQTKDSYIKDRLKDTCIWGLNAFNVYDGYLGFGKKGEATEQFTYTDGVVLPWPHPWDGGLWEANLPWAAACILLSCSEDIPDDFFGE